MGRGNWWLLCLAFATTAALMTAPRALRAGPAEDEALRNAAGCRQGNIDGEAVRAALKQGANPNAPTATARPISPLGCVAMALAVKSGEPDGSAVEVAKTLFAAGAKLGTADREILFFAIANGSVALVQVFIDHGASPTAKLEGFTPTELARKYNQPAVYDYLISRGGVPVDDSVAAQLALVQAAGRGDIAAMERAIAEGALINNPDANKRTALAAAVRNGVSQQSNADTIKWLLEHGADPNENSESGFKDLEGLPLHIFVVMTKYALNGPASATETPRPELRQRAEDTFARLLKAGAKVSGMDSSGRTPLHVAAAADNVRGAEILLGEGAKVMARDKTGKTPLDYAESASMIKLLKANGATER